MLTRTQGIVLFALFLSVFAISVGGELLVLASPFRLQLNGEMLSLVVGLSGLVFGLIQTIILFVTFWLMRDTAKTQLRAFLALSPKSVSGFINLDIAIRCITHNFGSTPAMKVWEEYDIAVFPKELPNDFVYPTPTKSIPRTFSAFPNTEHTTWFHKQLTNDEMVSVMAGTHCLHLWGVTHYVDVFAIHRTTKFQTYLDVRYAESVAAYVVGFDPPDYPWMYSAANHEAT